MDEDEDTGVTLSDRTGRGRGDPPAREEGESDEAYYRRLRAEGYSAEEANRISDETSPYGAEERAAARDEAGGIGEGLETIGSGIKAGWEFLFGDGGRAADKAHRAEIEWLRGAIPQDADLKVGPTEFDKIEGDSQAERAQRQALVELGNMAQGRYSDIDRARQEQILRRNALQERAQREAITANAQERGMGRSGVGLAAGLEAGQQAANRSSAEAMELESMAQQRALGALESYGGLGSQMRGQKWQEQAARAAAQDELNKFNSLANDRSFGMKRDVSALSTKQYGDTAQRQTDERSGLIGGLLQAIF